MEEHVRKAAQRSRARRRLAAVVERLRSVISDLETEKTAMLSCAEKGGQGMLATICTLASCLSELLVLWHGPVANRGLHDLCELLDCPQRPSHR